MRTGLLWKIPPEGCKGWQLPILHKRCNYGFPYFHLSLKNFKTKESRAIQLKSLIHFLLQTSSSPSLLLHNSMSQGLLGEASKHRKCPSQAKATLRYLKVRNYKTPEEKRKLNMKTGREFSDDKLHTINLYPISEWRHHWRAPFSVNIILQLPAFSQAERTYYAVPELQLGKRWF